MKNNLKHKYKPGDLAILSAVWLEPPGSFVGIDNYYAMVISKHNDQFTGLKMYTVLLSTGKIQNWLKENFEEVYDKIVNES